MTRFAVIIILLGFAQLGLGKQVALVTSTASKARSEAMTSYAEGTDALYYNPAALSWQRVSLRLVGIETAYDADSVRRSAEFKNSESQSNSYALEEFFSKMNSEKPIFVQSTARALDLAVPYFAVSSFADIQANSRIVDDIAPVYYDMDMKGDVGAIIGFSFKVGKFSAGFSHYALMRVEMDSDPTVDQFNTIRAAIEDYSFAEDTVPFREFTRLRYGGARGNNYGVLYRWWGDENPSGIGISILNAGGTEFKEEMPITNNQFKKTEAKMLEEAAKYNIGLGIPEALPEIVNVGMTIGSGSDDSVIRTAFSVDYNDTEGEYIENKWAASGEFALRLPDKLMLATSWPLYIDRNKNIYHMGLMGVRAFGGIRPGAYATSGLGVSFHFGFRYAISLLKLEIEGFTLTPIGEDSEYLGSAGLRAILGLTLVY